MRHIRLKVRTRIYLGFAVLVVLSLGIAAFGVYQLSGVSTMSARWIFWRPTHSAC
jgi:hypothetical protein